jgi:hypothetical protein
MTGDALGRAAALGLAALTLGDELGSSLGAFSPSTVGDRLGEELGMLLEPLGVVDGTLGRPLGVEPGCTGRLWAQH